MMVAWFSGKSCILGRSTTARKRRGTGKLFPSATRRARQPHRAMGRRPSPNDKGLKKTEENSSLLSLQLCNENSSTEQNPSLARKVFGLCTSFLRLKNQN